MALHPETDIDKADLRDALQWRFFVAEARGIEGRTATLESLNSRSADCDIAGLVGAIAWTRQAARPFETFPSSRAL